MFFTIFPNVPHIVNYSVYFSLSFIVERWWLPCAIKYSILLWYLSWKQKQTILKVCSTDAKLLLPLLFSRIVNFPASLETKNELIITIIDLKTLCGGMCLRTFRYILKLLFFTATFFSTLLLWHKCPFLFMKKILVLLSSSTELATRRLVLVGIKASGLKNKFFQEA